MRTAIAVLQAVAQTIQATASPGGQPSGPMGQLEAATHVQCAATRVVDRGKNDWLPAWQALGGEVGDLEV